MKVLEKIVRFIKRGFLYIQKYGISETILMAMHRIRLRFRRARIDPSSKASLSMVLEHMHITTASDSIISTSIEVIGYERTARMLENIARFEKFLGSLDGRRAYPLIHASSLPPASEKPYRRNILFITAEFPSPHHGGGNRVLNFIKVLSESNDIYLCTAYSAAEHEHNFSLIEPYCRRILTLPYGRFEGNQTRIRNWVGSTKIDVVHYEWPRSLENYDAELGRLQIFTYMEAVSLRLLMDMERIPPLSDAWIEKMEQLAYALLLEVVQASAMHARIAVTTKDAKFFEKIYPFQEYAILNHGLGFDEFSLPEVKSEPNTLVFVGNYLHYPNAEALDFFFNEIWGVICREVPDVKIYLVGTNPTEQMLRMADNRQIIVTGMVDDVREYIQKASVCIAPLISGAGLRGKVIEYAALRRPFVATSIASTDLAFRDGVDYFCADTAAEFSEKVIKLLKDENFACQMAARAYETARQNYDNHRLTGFLLSIYDYLENNFK